MKRIISAFLSILLCLSLTVSASALEAETVRVSRRPPPYVYVEGEKMLFPSMWQGRLARGSTLTYGDMTYIPLVTLGFWMGAKVLWDEETDSVRVTDNGEQPLFYDASFKDLPRQWGEDQFVVDYRDGVDAQLCSHISLTVNGQTMEDVTALLLRGDVHLPLNLVAELLGKQFLRFGGNIHLYDAPTPEKLAEAQTYLSHIRGNVKAIRDLVTGEAPQTEEAFLSLMRQTQAELLDIWEAPLPAFSPLAPYIDQITEYTLLLLNDQTDFYLPEAERSGTAQALEQRLGRPWAHTAGIAPLTFRDNWKIFTSEMLTEQYNVTTYFMELEDQCILAQAYMEAVSAAVPQGSLSKDPATYTDASQITNWEAVSALSRLGVLSGKEDGSFDPKGLITRAECAKIMVAMRCGGNAESIPAHTGAPAFSDIEGHWAEDHISYGKENLNILSGRGNDFFDPDAPVTGRELAKMALSALGYDPDACQLTGADWYIKVERLATQQCEPSLYQGLGDETPLDSPITREAAAQIFYNMLRNPTVWVIPDPSALPGELMYHTGNMLDENGQTISFLSAYFGQTGLEVIREQSKT